jgi:FkbM family methyltransferase
MDRQLMLDQGHIRLARCRYGPMLYLATDQYVGRSLDRYGEFSEDEADLLRMIIEPGWTILEVGANMGAHSVFLARATGPTGFLLAFEPQRVIFQILCANVALNALSNVYTYHAAVGRDETKLTVPCFDYTVERNYGHVGLGSWPEGDLVSQLTIDSLSLPSCHLIKIDVEGMEGEVIAGAEQTIRRFRPVLYVENDREEKSAALIGQLFTLGYRLYWHLPPLFNPKNFFGATEDVFGARYSGNMLGIHNAVEQHIQGLREITEPGDRWLWDRHPASPKAANEAAR